MKDNSKPCHHTVSEDVVYKDVVVIGNGPSGMVTSYMLAGNVPYLKDKVPEDLPIDEMLRARLNNLPAGQSLYEADLMELAEGLEGRSQNPMSLLMDVLHRPCADMGIQADPLIEWRFDIEKQIDHIVLGRGPPGGAWHSFPPAVRTLSPRAWLSLPPHTATGSERIPARAVAAYCRRYVKRCRLARYFRCGAAVGRVAAAPRAARACRAGCPLNARWCVSGYDKDEGRAFRYLCNRVVVATGGFDRPNTLSTRLDHPLHSLTEIERACEALRLTAEAGGARFTALVVGSGVSGADAVRAARAAGLRVAHVHRDPAPALRALTHADYPDYCQVYKMMCDGTSVQHENYIPYPEHVILKVKPDRSAEVKVSPEVASQYSDVEEYIRPRKVKMLNVVTNETVEITVHLIAVLIGSKPDLFFLQTNFDRNCVDFDNSPCPKCTEPKHASKRKMEDENQCFLKNHWHYLKSVLGQSIQSCKSRYLSSEINGNNDTKCIVPECNMDEKCTCSNLVSRLDNGAVHTEHEACKCQSIPYGESVKAKVDCQCQENPYSSGIGFGIDPTKPVDSRSNPLAVDKGTHQLLNAPEGIYALGPLTADNFIRFIPGGALAIVSDIHKHRKEIRE